MMAVVTTILAVTVAVATRVLAFPSMESLEGLEVIPMLQMQTADLDGRL
jgi:hypothetical protein